MLDILEGRAVDEVLPVLQVVGVLSLPDDLGQLLVVVPSGLGDGPQELGLALDCLLVPELAHHRQQEDDLVPFVQQEEGVVLNDVQDLLVFGGLLVEFAVVVQVFPLDFQLLVAGLNLLLEAALELLLLLVLDDVDCVVDHILSLLELAGVDDNQVLVQVELAHVLGDLAGHGEGEVQLLLHLLLQVVVDGVVEQLFPADALLGLGLQHLPDQPLAHL